VSELILPPLLIRADANTQMGHGHIMRCLALSQAFNSLGGTTVFLSCCESSSLRKRIESNGIDFIPLDQPHPHPSDLDTTLWWLEELSSKHSQRAYVVIDGYHFDPFYQHEIYTSNNRILVIDDMAHLPHYYTNILLNQNISAETLHYQCDDDAVQLLGTRYVLLRPEFAAWRSWQRDIPPVAQKILVTLGGSDPNNVTHKIIQTLQRLDVDEFEIIVVLGASNPHIEKLQDVVTQTRTPIRLLKDAHNMPDLMAWADLSISAGGTTCSESAFMGLPNIVLILAENQRRIAERLDHSYVAVNLGWHSDISELDFLDTLKEIIYNPTRRKVMAEEGQKLVDGYGVKRVLSTMTELVDHELPREQVKLRCADHQDATLLWEWANDPDVRANSFQSKPIPFDEHLNWFEGRLASEDTRIWILELNRAPAAQIRYEQTGNDTAEINFSAVSEYRGKGLGTKALILTVYKACRELGVKYLKGTVFDSNIASIRAFAKAGFELVAQERVGDIPCHRFVWECSEKSKDLNFG